MRVSLSIMTTKEGGKLHIAGSIDFCRFFTI
jgi:hypothetical protein